MARVLDDGEGVGIASRNLIDRIIELGKDRNVKYVVFYRTRHHRERYKRHSHVKELFVRAPSKLIWDQVLIPFYAWKENVDVIFHPKFTIPLFTKRPTVAICRGAEYYTFPQFYEWHDLLYVRLFFPMYYKKATKVITISNALQHDLHAYLEVPYEKMATVYSAPKEIFFPRKNSDELHAFKLKYRLPESFVLTVAKSYQGKKLYPRKNIDNVVKALMRLDKSLTSVKLVLAGSQCHRYIATAFGKDVADDPRFVYLGWIAQEEMPYLYSLARLLIFPSYSESFGLPLVEAMACGCPVITSTGGSCPEVVGNAAVVVDPEDVEALSSAIETLLTHPELSKKLSQKGFARAKEFSWDQSAEKLINMFRQIAMAELGAAGSTDRET